MLRVVYDTNTIISGIFWEGPPARAMFAARNKRVQLLSTDMLIAELEDVVTRVKFQKRVAALGKTPDRLLAEYKAIVEIVRPYKLVAPIATDPDDDEVLACAVGGHADYIVSGDNHLLKIREYQSIPIWDVNRFLTLLEDEKS